MIDFKPQTLLQSVSALFIFLLCCLAQPDPIGVSAESLKSCEDEGKREEKGGRGGSSRFHLPEILV